MPEGFSEELLREMERLLELQAQERHIRRTRISNNGLRGAITSPMTPDEAVPAQPPPQPARNRPNVFTATTGEISVRDLDWGSNRGIYDMDGEPGYVTYYADPPPPTTKKVKNIPSDERGKIMNNIVLTQAEISAMQCIDVATFYRNRHVSNNRYFRPLGEIIRTEALIENAQGVAEYQRLIGIIVGYSFNGKNFLSAEDLQPEYNKYSLSQSLFYWVAYHQTAADKSVKWKFIKTRDCSPLNGGSVLTFLKELKIRVKKADLSSRLFGLGTKKTDMVGKTFSDYSIDYGFAKKMSGETYYIIINHDGARYRFCMDDIEFVVPSIKGYNFPVDRTITKNSQVLVKNNKDCKHLPIGTTLVVMNVKRNVNSKRLNKNSTNRQLDMVVCRTLDDQEVRVYAKNVKLINSIKDDNTVKPKAKANFAV